MPAVLAVASKDNANDSLNLIDRRVNIMTTVCGTISATTLGLAFVFGTKHPYLLYTGATAAFLLRNQRQTLENIFGWLKDEYNLFKDVLLEYRAQKIGQKSSRRSVKSKQPATTEQPSDRPSPQEVTVALEKLGAASLTNCLLSGIAFAAATIGVYGDIY